MKSHFVTAKPRTVVRISNLIPFCREIQISMHAIIERIEISNDGFSSPGMQSAVNELLLGLNKKLKRINSSQKKKGSSPARLPLPSHRAAIWISFLADKDNLIEHLQALAEFFRLVHEMQMMNSRMSRYHGNQLNMNIFYMPYIYKTQIKGNQLNLTIHEPMIRAPIEIKRDLLLAALDGNRTSLKKVKRYCASAEYNRMENLIRGSTSTASTSSAGKNIDLDIVFERVNQEYFQGSLEKPQLTWSQKKSYRRLGTYAAQTDTVTISRTFDNINCPDYAVDFIMYHELLHKKNGVKKANSGRHNHTKKFKELERQFRFYAQANELIHRLAYTKKI